MVKNGPTVQQHFPNRIIYLRCCFVMVSHPSSCKRPHFDTFFNLPSVTLTSDVFEVGNFLEMLSLDMDTGDMDTGDMDIWRYGYWRYGDIDTGYMDIYIYTEVLEIW